LFRFLFTFFTIDFFIFMITFMLFNFFLTESVVIFIFAKCWKFLDFSNFTLFFCYAFKSIVSWAVNFDFNSLTAIVGYIRHDADVTYSACSASYRQNH